METIASVPSPDLPVNVIEEVTSKLVVGMDIRIMTSSQKDVGLRMKVVFDFMRICVFFFSNLTSGNKRPSNRVPRLIPLNTKGQRREHWLTTERDLFEHLEVRRVILYSVTLKVTTYGFLFNLKKLPQSIGRPRTTFLPCSEGRRQPHDTLIMFYN